MVFDHLVASIRNRTTRGRHARAQGSRPASAFMSYEEREETPDVQTRPSAPMTPAQKATPISQMTHQELLEATMKNFAGMRKSESRQALELPLVPHLKPMTFTRLSHIIPEEKNDDPFGAKKPIVRKPLSADSPIVGKGSRQQARAGLRARYLSRVLVEEGLLEEKIEADVAWVERVWREAGKGKPSDGDIAGFYDLWSYVEEDEALRVRPKSSML